MKKRNHKIIVVGLPKTGTSTLTVMLRMLGYNVTGPDIHFQPGMSAYLDEQFQKYDAFQDYPWCFEWQRYAKEERVLFIELTRDPEAWWRSFYDSYGGTGTNYLSYAYMQLEKKLHHKSRFLDFFEAFYSEFQNFKLKHPKRVLSLDISSFEWEDLCQFLNEPVPTNMFGRPLRKPHVHGLHHQKKDTSIYKIKRRFRQFLLPILGQKNWLRLTIFLRKLNLFS